MQAQQIRDVLRNDDSEDLRRRRNLITLSAIGLVDFAVISLYQTGVIRHLPDLPGKVFDSDGVNAAEDAYKMGMPDGPVGAAAYAATMILASAGGSEKTGRTPIFDVALGVVVLGNAAGAAHFLFNMVTKQKKVCLYCVTGALINFASAVIIAPTVLKGVKKMIGK